MWHPTQTISTRSIDDFYCEHARVVYVVPRGRLSPQPPVASKDPDARALHLHEDDTLDEDQRRSWFAQAAASRCWVP